MRYFVLINDIHLSDRAPASCTDSYLDDLFDLLDEAARLAQGMEAMIVLAGDVFHHKTPARTSHSTVMRLIDWARQALVPVFAVAGNHDLSHDRVASLHESQPLGVVLASGAIEMLDGWHEFEPIFGVPWQMTFDRASVNAALASYRVAPFADHHLVITHAPLYPPGRELKYEYFDAHLWAEAMGNSGTVHYGHVHESHGVYQVNGVTFSNCGALSRGSLTEANLSRIPSVAIWDAETGEIRHHELPAKPGHEVFRVVEANAKKAEALNLSGFLESVQSTRLDITSIDTVLDHVRRTHEDEALTKVIETLLHGAEQ